MKVKHLAFAIAGVISLNAAIAQTKAPLNLKKGQKYQIENKVVTASTTEVQGQAMEVNINAATLYEIEVKDVKDNNYSLSNTISSIDMKMSQMGQEISFDSKKTEDLDGPMGSALKGYINTPQTVVITKEGTVVPGDKDTSATQENPIAKQFGDFEATGFGATIAFRALPKDLKAGTTWDEKSDEGSTNKATTYTVKSVSGNTVTLDLKGTLNIDSKMENQGMELHTISKGTFTGEEVVDKSTGVVQSQNVIINTNGSIEVMGQELPTSAKVTSNTTVKTL